MSGKEKVQASKQPDLGTAPIGKLMVKYSVPCIISLVVAALYNIVDQLFIANASYLGSYGNAANTAVFPLVVICLAVSGMFGDGTGAYYTFCVGAGRKEDGKNSVGSSVTSVAVLGTLIAIIYIAFSEPILNLFGANVNAGTFNNAKEYLFWISLGIPFFMLAQMLGPVICGDGSPRRAMMAMLIGCSINVVLDPILIYKAGWGMKGAAIATIAGQIASFFLNAHYLFKMKNVKLTASCFMPRFSALRQVIPLGMTSFFTQISIVLSMATVNNMLGIYGSTDKIFCQEQYAQIPLAVAGLVLKFFQIVVSISIGLIAGSVPIIGYNRGAGRTDRLIELYKKVTWAEAAIGTVFFILFECFAGQLTNLFGAANESIYYRDFAVVTIRVFLCMLTISCVNKGVMIFLQGMGMALKSMIISIVRELLGGVGLPLLLPLLFGFKGILFFMPLAEIITFAFVFHYGLGLRRELRTRAAEEKEAMSATPSRTAPAEPTAETGLAPLTDMIITIGRSYGAGGRSVGRLVAEILNIPYYDSALLEQAAERSGLSRKFLTQFDEKPADVSQLYQYRGFGAAAHYGVLEGLASQAQREIIEQVASQGPCVIVGRRADRILEGTYRTLNVFITASSESRAERVTEREGLSELESIKKIAKVDRERAAYYNQRSDRVWGDPASYDLCIDTEKFGVEGTARLIAAVVTSPAAATLK